MRYINLRFTYLLTYLLTGNRARSPSDIDKRVLAVVRSCNYHERVTRHTRQRHLISTDRAQTTWLVVASSQESTTGSLLQCYLAQRSSQQHPEAIE